MSTLFTINACKSFGCRNLGQPTSTDYSWPDYRLGYPALHCRACGSYPPLFDEQQFRDWLTVHLSTFATEKGHFARYVMAQRRFVMVTIHRVRNAFNAVTAKSMDTQTISERNNDSRNNRNGCFARAISGSQQRAETVCFNQF